MFSLRQNTAIWHSCQLLFGQGKGEGHVTDATRKELLNEAQKQYISNTKVANN